MATATVPDVCKTPSPGGPVPIPYPNIARVSDLADGTTTVKGDGEMAAIKGSKLARSSGDEAGTAGGVKSNTFGKEATWILYSFDVQFEGQGVCRLTDKMFMNSQNTVCLGGLFNPPISYAKDPGGWCKALRECIREIVGEGREGKNGKYYKDRGLEERMNQNRGIGIKHGEGFGPKDYYMVEINGVMQQKFPWKTHNDEILRTQKALKEALATHKDKCEDTEGREDRKMLANARERAEDPLPSADEWPNEPRGLCPAPT
jgi:hypothetical protein